jgi:hypothetical protein
MMQGLGMDDISRYRMRSRLSAQTWSSLVGNAILGDIQAILKEILGQIRQCC